MTGPLEQRDIEQRPEETVTLIDGRLKGILGTADHLDPQAHRETPATLTAWFLTLPGVHPFWPNSLLTVVHLRPAPGAPLPTLIYPQATHELAVFALDPAAQPQPSRVDTWRTLLPPNFVYQFHGLTDSGAASLGDFSAQQVVDGVLWAEPTGMYGARDLWHRLLGREHARLLAAGTN
jgi:hypothetical protein